MSNLFKLSWSDLAKAFVTFLFAGIVYWVLSYFHLTEDPLIKSAIASLLGHLGTSLLSDNQGKLGGKL